MEKKILCEYFNDCKIVKPKCLTSYNQGHNSVCIDAFSLFKANYYQTDLYHRRF